MIGRTREVGDTFQKRQEKTQVTQGNNAMFDALQRANLIDKQGSQSDK